MRHDAKTWQRLCEDVSRLGVAEACRRHGIHRSTWYRRREEVAPPPPGPKLALVAALREICADRPDWGCDRIAYYLGLSGIKTSSPTIQKTLISLGLGRREQRLRAARGPGEGARAAEAETPVAGSRDPN